MPVARLLEARDGVRAAAAEEGCTGRAADDRDLTALSAVRLPTHGRVAAPGRDTDASAVARTRPAIAEAPAASASLRFRHPSSWSDHAQQRLDLRLHPRPTRERHGVEDPVRAG